ncbi:Transcription factor bHLH155 [Platanthera guangdongensis]|uniref:Transcription factor bHLH155 n=1 Tax=Platanthera guangdongensis TaxID=2320717 RepID=A0ABR2MR91_9ASPA
MEDQPFNPLAITHLLQHTLRSFCINKNSHWLYAVFWRILPRNFPPPKWDFQGAAACDRGRGNRRNWILVWEDGYCNFDSPPAAEPAGGTSSSMNTTYGEEPHEPPNGLQPELFFKMSHEIYNYGEGLIGKVAAEHGHKWVYNDPLPQQHEVNLLSAWSNPADYHPRTWEAQFQSGIKTIALIAVKEGVIQLGAVNKVLEDISFIIFLRKKFAFLESIPGVLLPHTATSSSSVPIRINGCDPQMPADTWLPLPESMAAPPPLPMFDPYNHHFGHHQMRIAPSMNSLEALLSKLPSVGPAPAPSGLPDHLSGYEMPVVVTSAGMDGGEEGESVAKEESSDSMPAFPYYANMRKPAEEF